VVKGAWPTVKSSPAYYNLSLSILTAIFQVNLRYPVFIEAKDDGGGGDDWTTGAISCAMLHSDYHHQ